MKKKRKTKELSSELSFRHGFDAGRREQEKETKRIIREALGIEEWHDHYHYE